MFIEMKKRKYQQTRRAEQQQATRRQIVEAAMTLHEELGPANTSIKAVAEQAGVQRLTVYRHFPDEASLFQACTSHWLELHPPPAIDVWAEKDEPARRCAAALHAVYAYYRQTEAMWRVAYRDREQVEALQGPMAEFEAYLDQIRDDLLSVWKSRGKTKKQLSLTLRHALRFSTWDSLRAAELTDRQMTELVLHWLDGILTPG